MHRRICCWLPLLTLLLAGSGCGSFVARRIAQAPNSYPTWFAPHARVELHFGTNLLTGFPPRNFQTGPPVAKLRYRVIEPADYHFEVSSSNWVAKGRTEYRFTFHATVPGATNQWSAAPRGTVILLHGYGLAQFAMAPWALRLAEDGWRCVLVDLRGHGKSTGKRVYFGLQETSDLSRLVDELASRGELAQPVAAVGESYGGALALRWKGIDPRVGPVVAIAPYASLSNAVLAIANDYVSWTPDWLLKSGLKKLPTLLETTPSSLDTDAVLTRLPVPALFVAGEFDKIATPGDVEKLQKLATPGSPLVVVPDASHEALTYFFDDMTRPILDWLSAGANAPAASRAAPAVDWHE